MSLGFLGYYLVVLNLFGMLYFPIYLYFLAGNKANIHDTILTVTSLLGGSLGIFISILIFDRKSRKSTMMSRVFCICILIMQIMLFSSFKLGLFTDFSFAFWNFFVAHQFTIVYLVVINIVTLIVFAIDKINAIQRRSRIRNVTLLGLSLIGGTIGGLMAMYLCRHKINKDYFAVGLPLMCVMQVMMVLYLNNLL